MTPTRAYAIEHLGITNVDIRDIEPLINFDIMRIRTWNHRTFHVNGLTLSRLYSSIPLHRISETSRDTKR